MAGIILDTNCFSHLFKQDDTKHKKFKPILRWFILGKGQFTFGGSHYLLELKKCKYVLHLFAQINKVRSNKLLQCDKNKVDASEQKVKAIIPVADFDDPHLAAIVNVSKCQVICTEDSRAHKYLKENSIYEKGVKKPSFYSDHTKHKKLLDVKHTGPGADMPKELKEQLATKFNLYEEN